MTRNNLSSVNTRKTRVCPKYLVHDCMRRGELPAVIAQLMPKRL